MKDQFGDRLRQVEVASLKGRSYSVKVQFDNKMRLTTEATKGYMEGEMQDAYKNLYTSGLQIATASIEAFGAGTDAYGNSVSSPAYQTSLEGGVASKINWNNHRNARWDILWDVIFLHGQYTIGNRPVTNKKTPLDFNTPIWDIPSLLYKSRDETDTVLGVPERPHFDNKPGEYSGNYSIWDKEETTLFIRFTPENNAILEIQLNFSPNEGHDYPDSRKAAMTAGNLKIGDSRYTLEFSEVKEEGKLKRYSSVKATLR